MVSFLTIQFPQNIIALYAFGQDELKVWLHVTRHWVNCKNHKAEQIIEENPLSIINLLFDRISKNRNENFITIREKNSETESDTTSCNVLLQDKKSTRLKANLEVT